MKKINSIDASLWITDCIVKMTQARYLEELRGWGTKIAKSMLEEVENPADAFAMAGSQIFEYKKAKIYKDSDLAAAQEAYLALHQVLRDKGVDLYDLPVEDDAW